MKWTKNDVTIQRRNYRTLVAKFDVSPYWFMTNWNGWTGTQIEEFRACGKFLGASTVEIRYAYDDNDNPIVEDKEIMYIVSSDGKIKFRQEFDVPEGCKRKFKYFSVEEILNRESKDV